MTVFLALAAAGLVSWLLRVAFITVVPSSRLPAKMQRALEGAGPAVLAALVVTELSHQVQAMEVGEATATLGAAVVTGIFAWLTKKPTLTVVVGTVTFWIMSAAMG